LRWAFDPIPHDPSDPEFGNWEPGSLARTGGGNVWSLLSVDQDRDLVFLPTASASPNFYGGTRPGDNRYANSVVALRGSTGEVVWHFQAIHHDVWDWDLPAQPILVDVTRDGEKIPVVVLLTKPGMVFVFHRETGEPFFPIEERSVPTDGVPGEVLSPTQPFPVKPPLLMKTGITPGDAWGMTLLDRGACRDMIASSRHGDIFTPPSTDGWIMYPGTGGGMNWGGGAFDPKRNLLITSVSQVGMWLKLMSATDAELNAPFDPSVGAPMGPKAPIRGTPYALKQGILLSPMFMPCTAPPWSSLVGVDLAAGEVSWSVPLGVIDKMARMPLPMKWGTPTAGGPIVSAGGLVFVGSTADRRFRAFDIDTGDELWVTEIPKSAHATPMTYEIDGRQFVVIAAGGHMFIDATEIDDYLLAYALSE
jgi:quinoprotein glucose dehydrogenase